MRRTALPGSIRNTTHMDVGSAENARSNFQPTTMDGGSADIAYVQDVR